MPDTDAATDAALATAIDRLLQGRLVAFPTETVYGLGADAENPDAIARIYAAKGRPSNHPVIVHLAPDADLDYWAGSVPASAQALIKAFWPGPLTLILPRAAHIPAAVSGGQDSVGLRCPSDPVAKRLLAGFAQARPGSQGGLAAPSANKFGQVSPTRAEHVRSEFSDLGDELLVLEGGASQVGIESTIVDLSRVSQGRPPALLRPGHISAEQVAQVLGVEPVRPDADAPRVSGSLKAHYAPHTPLHLLSTRQLEQYVLGLGKETTATAIVAFGEPPADLPALVRWVRAADRASEYARDLYALLRGLDDGSVQRIVMEQPPGTAEWQAVNDRIGRAAAAFEAKRPDIG